MISDVLMVITNIIVAVLHAIGFWLLCVTRKTRMSKNQRIFLMNLSLSEFLLCLLAALDRVLIFSGESNVRHYVMILNYTVAPLNLFLVMMFLTVDRFLEIFLTIRYPLYWSVTCSKYSMALTWFVSVVSGIICLVFPQSEDHLWELFYLYVYPTCDFVFILTAAGTYGYIFRRIKFNKKFEKRQSIYFESQSNLSVLSTMELHKVDTQLQKCPQKKRSRLFVPSLIIVTFIVFIVVPDQVHFYAVMFHVTLPHIAYILTFISYSISHASDVIIYVFLSPALKKTLKSLCSGRKKTSVVTKLHCSLSGRRFRNRVSSN